MATTTPNPAWSHPIRSILGLAIVVLSILYIIDSTRKWWELPAAMACVGAAFILWER